MHVAYYFKAVVFLLFFLCFFFHFFLFLSRPNTDDILLGTGDIFCITAAAGAKVIAAEALEEKVNSVAPISRRNSNCKAQCQEGSKSSALGMVPKMREVLNKEVELGIYTYGMLCCNAYKGRFRIS